MTATQSLAREYSASSDAYARRWAPVIAPMAKPIFGALPLAGPPLVLDVGSGTGAMLPYVRAAAPQARVVGLDRAEGMLDIAKAAGWRAVAVADGQKLPARSGAVDVGLLVFVLFHFPDPVEALREMRRALRPEGRVGIVVWGTDPGVPGASVWMEELDRKDAAPDTRDPSVVKVQMMNTPEKLTQLIHASGLEVTTLWSEWFCHAFKLEELLKLQLGCGVASRRLPSLSAKRRAKVEARVRERLAEFTPEQLEYRPEVLFAVAG
ncbi:MAG: class I SAM-dependent methyltransferase [Gemmatimonadota bacterium]|nr:class I SAM-dependent methyltransferase [Gemmatimonadota bacterium]